MKCEKPITDNIKQKANALYEYLLTQDDYVSKEQIGAYLGIKNERSVRDVISLLATKRPIISHSGNKGYKLARHKSDLDEVERCWYELSSRVEELEKRMQPLITFRDKVKFNIGEQQ